MDGSPDGDRLIHRHAHIDRLGDFRLELRQLSANAVDSVDDIGPGLAEDDDQNRRLGVCVAGAPNVFHRVHGPSNV